MPLHFQICSDLHIDTRGGYYDCPDTAYPLRRSKILLLAGDLCQVNDPNYTDILNKACKPFDLVLYVSGNHEYYGSGDIFTNNTMHDVDVAIELACRDVGNVIYMNNKRINIDGVSIAGTTLWTNCPNDSSLMNDFTHIFTGPRTPLTPRYENLIHYRDRKWLDNAMDRSRNERLAGSVVLSHHAPLWELHDGNKTREPDMWPFYYSTDMNDAFAPNYIGCWVHGHTHETYVRRVNSGRDTLFATNALGYYNENPNYSQTMTLSY